VIEHCISSFKNRQEEKAFRIYVTDAGYQIANAIGKVYGAKEDLLSKRYFDIIKEAKEPVKQESGEEIIARIKKKLEG